MTRTLAAVAMMALLASPTYAVNLPSPFPDYGPPPQQGAPVFGGYAGMNLYTPPQRVIIEQQEQRAPVYFCQQFQGGLVSCIGQ